MGRPPWTAVPVWVVVIGFFYLLAPWGLDQASPGARVPGWPPAVAAAGVAIGALGLGLVLAGLAGHFASSGAAAPLGQRAPAYLLRGRAYRVSRNPMYLGGIAVWLGWGLGLGSALVLAAAGLYAAFLDRVQVPREERVLEARWGEAYLAYKARVPRWLGRPR